MAKLAYIVDPRKEHNPPPSTASGKDAPKAATSAQGKKAVGKGSATPEPVVVDNSMIGAFQQQLVAVHGKEWTGITGEPCMWGMCFCSRCNTGCLSCNTSNDMPMSWQ